MQTSRAPALPPTLSTLVYNQSLQCSMQCMDRMDKEGQIRTKAKECLAMSDLELTLRLCVVGTNDEEERKQEALANKFIQEETV